MLHTLRAGRSDIEPIVCVHPVTGAITPYRALAAALAWDGPVVAIAAPAGGGEVELADLAARYLGLLDPAVPLRVLGWGLGGVIAAEMAAGAPSVRFVGLIDSRAPTPDMRARPTDRATLARAFVQHTVLARELALVTPTGPDAAAVLAALREAGADDGADETAIEERLQTFAALVRAFYRHTPRPVPIAIDLYESTESHPSHPKPPTLGWDGLAPAVVHHPVPGNHFTVLARLGDGLRFDHSSG